MFTSVSMQRNDLCRIEESKNGGQKKRNKEGSGQTFGDSLMLQWEVFWEGFFVSAEKMQRVQDKFGFVGRQEEGGVV